MMNQNTSISLVVAVNDRDVYNRNIMESPCVRDEAVRVLAMEGHRSAGAAYDAGLKQCDSDIVVFVHQDVYLPAGWDGVLREQLEKLRPKRPAWAVAGVFGVRAEGGHVGHVWSTGLYRELGRSFADPVPATSLDELLLVVRRDSGVRFDEAMPGFHLFATDLVQSARAAGFGAYIIDAPVIHNSLPARHLGTSYWDAYAYMQRKWSAALPISTCILPVTRSPWSKWRYKLREKLRNSRSAPRTSRHHDPARLADELGYHRPCFESEPISAAAGSNRAV